MRFHIDKHSEVTAHQQLREQIIFLISTGDLPVGAEMPSVRGLSRTLRISPNTVSKVYAELVRGCWLVERPGAHHIVVENKRAVTSPPAFNIDHLIDQAINLAYANGYSLQQLAARIRERLLNQPPDHFLVVEPEPGIGEILRYEIQEKIGHAPATCDLQIVKNNPATGIGAVLIAPAYLVDKLGSVPAHLRRVLPVAYSPLDELLAAISGLSQPSMIGLVCVSGAGLRTVGGILSSAAGIQHSIHLFHSDRVAAASGELRIQRFRLHDYTPTDILRPATQPAEPSVVHRSSPEECQDGIFVSQADLRCMDLLICDSINYRLVEHPRRIRYQLLSEESLASISAEASRLIPASLAPRL